MQEPGFSHFLLQESSPQRDPLLQLPPFLVVLRVSLHLYFALISVEKFQLLLQLHPQNLTLPLLSLIQSQLRNKNRNIEVPKKQKWQQFKEATQNMSTCSRALSSHNLNQLLTACVESISLMEWSYCSAKMANFLVCSSLSLFSTALWSDLGVVSSRWFLRALYCLVWVLQVSWNCFLIWSSFD